MASLKGTRTEKNLLTAFAGESQARNRYNYFASKARKEGFVQIADIFQETADQEKDMPRGSSSSSREARWRSRDPSRPA
jgi:rubrerythrin